MPETKRFESRSAPEVADRDSRAEALLVEGLERYFAGEFDEAIHIWTRVLFLDRSHARARAYIDRARTALAERQRRAEEMLQTTGRLLAGGDVDAARRLLAEAVAAGADDSGAAAVGLQLDRVERMRTADGPDRGAVRDAVPVQARRRLGAIVTAMGLAALLVTAMVASTRVRQWLGIERDSQRLPTASVELVTAPPTTAQAALLRARTLYARGRLAEALAALDRIDPDSPSGPEADGLRTEIQRLLVTEPGASR
jgi:tetratricopeptide (TPR) repeat protein